MAVLGWIKEHPYEVAGGVFVVGLIAVVVINSGSSSVPASTDNSSLDAAEVQAEEAASSQAAQSAASNQAAQLQLDEAQISATVTGTQYADTLTALQTQYNDQLAATQDQDTTAQNINTTNVAGSVQNTSTIEGADVAETTAQADAQLETALGADSANVQIAQANATTQQLISEYSSQALEAEAGDLSKASMANSASSLIGGFASVLGAVL